MAWRWRLTDTIELESQIQDALERRLEPVVGAPDLIDEEMPYLFYGGEEPPNVGTPTGTWTELHDALGELETSADGLVGWARESTGDLRSVGARHPVFGVLNAAQWLRLSAVHTWRHRSQLLAVRRAVGG